jgi:hypothetical protein
VKLAPLHARHGAASGRAPRFFFGRRTACLLGLSATNTFLLEQTSHQQLASRTFLSEKTGTRHEPPAERTASKLKVKRTDSSCCILSKFRGWRRSGVPVSQRPPFFSHPRHRPARHAHAPHAQLPTITAEAASVAVSISPGAPRLPLTRPGRLAAAMGSEDVLVEIHPRELRFLCTCRPFFSPRPPIDPSSPLRSSPTGGSSPVVMIHP